MNHGQPESTAEKKWAPPFFTIWTGQAISLLGSQLVQFALIWWLTKTTGSATVLATASLIGLLPQVVLGPISGAFVDRWNRRVTMIVADSIIALATLGLALLFWLGDAQVWQVYLLMFIRSVAGGFHWPAMQASTSLMIPKEHLARIQGINQMLNGGLNIASAPLGALLLEYLPMGGILAIDVSTALLAIVPLFFIPIPQPERRASPDEAPQEKTSVWQDFVAGLRYVREWPALVLILVMAMLINFLLNPAGTLQPILVTKHFNGDAIHLAAMESTWGIGVILGGLTLSAWGGFKRRIATSMVGLLGIGAGSLVIGLLPPTGFTIAVGAMFLLGFTMPITNGPLIAAIQAAVDPEMQGRVFTLVGSFASAMSPLGLIIAGPVADTLGVQSWYVVGGVVTALMGLAGFFIPALMRFEEGRQRQDQAEAPSQPESPAALAVSSLDGD